MDTCTLHCCRCRHRIACLLLYESERACVRPCVGVGEKERERRGGGGRFAMYGLSEIGVRACVCVWYCNGSVGL